MESAWCGLCLARNVYRHQAQVTFRRFAARMSGDFTDNKNKFYRVVLTGGPCGGKTTGQARLSTFFENLGWKMDPRMVMLLPAPLSFDPKLYQLDYQVFRCPEAAMIYLSGGVTFPELENDEIFKLQENIIRTMMQIENTYMELAKSMLTKRNVLVICDRGVMDGSAYLHKGDWEKMKQVNKWNEIDIRDNRYNQIIHMVSAAKGAEDFYTVAGHKTRHEDLEGARQIDSITANAWVGHPYYDVIDNSVDFETKLTRMIAAVCNRMGIDAADRLAADSKKRKFLVSRLPGTEDFPHHQTFTVVHDYLVTPSRKMQARLRRRGHDDNWTYTHTIRRPEINKQSVELRMPISARDYDMLLAQRDDKHATVYKKRHCFLYQNQYFQLDEYTEPCPDKCQGLILLETYTTSAGRLDVPKFLKIEKEVTDDPMFSMFNLSLKEEFSRNKKELDLSKDEDE